MSAFDWEPNISVATFVNESGWRSKGGPQGIAEQGADRVPAIRVLLWPVTDPNAGVEDNHSIVWWGGNHITRAF